MIRLKPLGGLLFVAGAYLLLCSFLPIGTAFEFSEDEGFGVMKSFLCYKGHVLYREVWSDQPPALTVMLTTAFKWFGPSILTARLLTAAFGLILIIVFYELVRKRSGKWCALVGTFLLVASPGVLLLSVAVMKEVPAMAAALLSAWLLFRWTAQRHWGWLCGSGAAMALAMQIKIPAFLVIPAMIIEFSLLLRTRSGPQWGRELMRMLLLWSASLAAVFIAIGLVWGKGSFEMTWKTHTSTQDVLGLSRAEEHRFETELLGNHFECVLAAAACLVLAARRKRVREIVFPIALLLTDALPHAIHRPWWSYYYLHLAVPLAWLAGWTVNELIQSVLRMHTKQRFTFGSAATWKQLALCGLVALVIARSERRLEGSVKDLCSRPSADANPIVQKMREYAGRTHWVYAASPIYAFHAQLPIPPKLAVVSPKRFWSGQITTAEIIEACRRYEPELLVLPASILDDEWKDFLEMHYAATADKQNVLYVRQPKTQETKD